MWKFKKIKNKKWNKKLNQSFQFLMKLSLKFLILVLFLISLMAVVFIYLKSNKTLNEPIQHFCLFHLRKLTKLEQETIYNEVKNYISKIEFIKIWSFGENTIHPNEYILTIEINSQEELNSYFSHPSHRNFVTFLKSYYQKNHICLDWKVNNVLRNE
jgi:hypothetical protein